MKSINISGHRREGAGKSSVNQLRSQGYVPCELYGKNGNTHFAVFVNDFKEIVYTPDTYRVELDIDGDNFSAIMREVQFHPLNDEIIHADFHEIDENKPVKIKLPINFTGVAAGVREGGKFIKKLRSLTVKGLIKDMPDTINVDISDLTLGKSIKVRDINTGNLEILTDGSNPLATVEVPRGMKGKAAEEAAAAAPAKKK